MNINITVQRAHFRETRYERYAPGGHPMLVNFKLLQAYSRIKTWLPCERVRVRNVLGPLNVSSTR